MADLKWLEGYAGQSVDELIDMASEYRIDSIVLAFEQAIQATTNRDRLSELSEGELTILAVEALEREVNNGGYHQFFLNTPEYAPHIVAALQRIGCTRTADISTLSISLIGLRHPFTTERVEAALEDDPDGTLIEILIDKCDGPYYDSGEPIADRLFAYIRDNRGSIRIRKQDAR